jgi:hypothetical protein
MRVFARAPCRSHGRRRPLATASFSALYALPSTQRADCEELKNDVPPQTQTLLSAAAPRTSRRTSRRRALRCVLPGARLLCAARDGV